MLIVSIAGICTMALPASNAKIVAMNTYWPSPVSVAISVPPVTRSA
jgi:hypothetical protein